MKSRWIGGLGVLMLTVACSSTSPDYDADAIETQGSVTTRKEAGTFNRTVQPLGLDASGAIGGYLGYILARRLFDQQSRVTLYEYTVALDGGREVKVVREWGADQVGDCVKVFESLSGRKDYPRMVKDRCAAAK